MDSYSSGNIKTRKPYTITKQRERWTEDEHNSFLEALKLYGRAWQRIEEHIGTKTAVQIRSHAQKFFTKLEKEAVAKGVPIRETLDMEIPPPRPKRKPNYPYPRKIGLDGKQTSLSLVSSLQSVERKPESERANNEDNENGNENSNENSKTSEEGREGPCASLSSENGNSKPGLEEVINHDESYITVVETRKHQDNNTIRGDTLSLSINDIRGVPRHVPVQVVDGNHPEILLHESTVTKQGAAASATATATASSYPSFHPLLHVSPNTISSLIVSSLLQNPAAHAAATFAAKLWHPEDSSGTPPTPSMSAIAAATVAAATAWWAAHGLLPVCYPPYPPFPTPINNPPEQQDKMVADAQKIEDLSSSEDSGDVKLNTQLSPVDETETTPPPPLTELHDSNKTNVRKQVDRSSCGSNTTSSSEIETDALQKHGDENNKGSDVNLDSISRRSRGAIAPNESWKEVSEEGRLAFQALFSREVLPQSFSVGDKQLDLNMMNQESNGEEGLLRIGLAGGGKLNVHYTGFKPYKRCSIESKETKMVTGSTSTATHNDDKGAKRMRLEAEAST